MQVVFGDVCQTAANDFVICCIIMIENIGYTIAKLIRMLAKTMEKL